MVFFDYLFYLIYFFVDHWNWFSLLFTVPDAKWMKTNMIFIFSLANKHDVDSALDEVDVCEQLDLEEMVNESKCPCRVVSTSV